MAFEIPDIPGAEQVVQWFGYWPDFHDAEVLSICLDRSTGAVVQIHTFEKTPQVNARGLHILAKHAIVTFMLEGFALNPEGIATTRIEYFNHQNVLSGATVEQNAEEWRLVLHPCFGVDGSLGCKNLKVKLRPLDPESATSFEVGRA